MITIKEHEPIKTSVEEPSAPVEAPKDPEPPRPGRMGRLFGWVRSNLLLLAIIAVQGYTLAEVQAAKGYANSARWRASSAESAAENAEYEASYNGSKLIEIETSLQYGQYTVQCSKY